MNINYFVTGRNVTVQMSFDEMRQKFISAGECLNWNWSKLEEALNAGFKVVMPLGIEIQQA